MTVPDIRIALDVLMVIATLLPLLAALLQLLIRFYIKHDIDISPRNQQRTVYLVVAATILVGLGGYFAAETIRQSATGFEIDFAILSIQVAFLFVVSALGLSGIGVHRSLNDGEGEDPSREERQTSATEESRKGEKDD